MSRTAPRSPRDNRVERVERVEDPRRVELRHAFTAALLMILAVAAVYWPTPSAPGATTLVGSDYLQLHVRRITYAREALSAPGHALPAWYPRELFGTPFWSNPQNFPFLPTRLALLPIDPADAYAVAVEMAAILTALFTFLYCRAIKLPPLAAAAAGFTFAGCGFFASRVMAGHLTLLEAFPSLPLLLLLVERLSGGETAGPLAGSASAVPAPADSAAAAGARVRRAGGRERWRLLGLGLSAGIISLAGHPQLPVYALLVAGAYALYRNPNRHGLRLLGVMGLGVGCAAFCLYPTWLLVRRSTRVLPLAPASNDLPFPYRRLLAFVLPWHDGWPALVNRAPAEPFTGYPTDAWFWDTVCYLGWLPLAAAGFLAVRAVARVARAARSARGPSAAGAAGEVTEAAPIVGGPVWFLAAVGLLALLLALPFASLGSHLPGTFLRSPSRQLYVTCFAASVGLAAAVAAVERWRKLSPGARRGIAMAVFALQVLDLGTHDRAFIKTVAFHADPDPDALERLRRQVGDGRVAMDFELPTPLNRRVDDVGFFDAIALARPYEVLLDLAGVDPHLNVEHFNGSQLSERALAFAGVKQVISLRAGPAAASPAAASPGGGASRVRVDIVKDPAPRAAFFPAESVIHADAAQTHRFLRDPASALRDTLLLPADGSPAPATHVATQPATQPAAPAPPLAAHYERPSADEIVVTALASRPGVLRVLESWDPGWSATVDGKAASPVPVDGAFLAVPLGSGWHEVRFHFTTPGATAGAWLSLGCLGLLAAVCFFDTQRQPPRRTARPRRRAEPSPSSA